MTGQEIILQHSRICNSLCDKRIFDAFLLMRPLLKELQEWWAISKKDELETVYRQLLFYYVESMEDPQRSRFYRELQVNVFTLADKIKELLLLKSSTLYEYTQKRYLADRSIDFGQISFELESHFSNLLLGDLLQESLNVQGKQKEFAAQHESTMQKLFSHFWLMEEWTSSETDFLTKCLSNKEFDSVLKSHLISAVTLNLLRTFDAAKLSFLLSQALHEEVDVRQRALVGVVLAFCRYRRRLPFYDELMAQLKLLADDKRFSNELEIAIIQIVRTLETETVTKRIQEEFLPEMRRLSPLVQKKMEESIEKISDFDEKNPEWQKILEESGIADKIQQFTEMQIDGTDVYVSTFAALKSFPFFNDISNWFLPFDVNHTEVSDLFDKKDLLTIFIKNPYLCNSDKYSFCLSVLQMSATQRDMMMQAFNADMEQIDEMMSNEAKLDVDTLAKRFSNQYVQDLYRFYTLHPHHTDFQNPLQDIVKVTETPLFDIILTDVAVKRRLAEFYFSKDIYREALRLFADLKADDAESSNAMLQKMGYCCQRMDDLKQALNYYQEAELLEPDNKWTLRKIAYCSRRLGQYEVALDYYQRLDKLQPDSTSVLMNMAICYFQQEKYQDALSVYFKMLYLSPDNPKIWRLITWCYFIIGNFASARKYCEKAIADHPINSDYLNLGHICLAENKLKEAVEAYSTGLRMTDDKTVFWNLFADDVKYLQANGVERDAMAMVADAVKYKEIT